MHKSENRDNYLQNFTFIFNSVNLTPDFLDKLRNHPYFKNEISYVENLGENEKKVFILTELTKTKYKCNEIIKLLNLCGQSSAAQKLDVFNTSKGAMKWHEHWDPYVEVRKTTSPHITDSKITGFSKINRGKCVIFNNVVDKQLPDHFNGYSNESTRFEHVFKALHFEVEIKYKRSANQMRADLTALSKLNALAKSDALVVMVLSHGVLNKQREECILGFEACDALRRINFGDLSEEDPEVKEVIKTDVISIAEILDFFSLTNCNNLVSIPKLFFFTCCRNKDKDRESHMDEDVGNKVMSGPVKKNPEFEMKFSPNTFVSLSCAKEFKTLGNHYYGISYFGQALSLSLAEFACEENLTDIMNRTTQRLEEIYNCSMKEDERRLKEDPDCSNQSIQLHWGSFATEITTHAIKRAIYFNPGYVNQFV